MPVVSKLTATADLVRCGDSIHSVISSVFGIFLSAQLLQSVQAAAQAIRAGQLVAFATETVYGLGADALNSEAVARIFVAKQRPHFDPLIVHLADRCQLGDVVSHQPKVATQLMDAFWPGPLTLVLPKQPSISDLVTSGLSTVGVRIPDHPQAQELLRLAGVPVAAPSANAFGRMSPTTAQHVLNSLGERIDYVLDGGPCRVGVESTVLYVTDDRPAQLLRPGGVTIEQLELVIGNVERPATSASTSQVAPGMLPQHYAPSTPLSIVDDPTAVDVDGLRCGLLTLQTIAGQSRFTLVEVLSETGSLIEACTGFFAALRRLDAAGLDRIVAVPFPEKGLGVALNDRLTRAAYSEKA